MLIKTLTENWSLLQSSADENKSAADIVDKTGWLPACVPGTAAQALQNAGKWTIEDTLDFDAFDWWYKTSFECEDFDKDRCIFMNFDGLATYAEVWLNDQLILSSTNMFIRHQIDVTYFLQTNNELVICFRSIKNKLSEKKPRPKWKTKLVAHQQLRWIRTTLLGRIPGWSPPVAPVGPWQKITVGSNQQPTAISLQANVKENSGIVDFSCQFNSQDDISDACFSIGGHDFKLNIVSAKDSKTISGNFKIPNINLWWPHTHGKPYLYQAQLSIQTKEGIKTFELPKIGFKAITLDQSDNNFSVSVNGLNIFCRGACWTINDIISLSGRYEELVSHLTLMKEAGANMIRIGGTMTYEHDSFYELCDQLGIMVWQDFMFANMDYPFENADFLNSVTKEINQQVRRLNNHVCLSVYCGNSEIEQQIAMLGFEQKVWQNDFFYKILADLCSRANANIPYVTSSPTGGDLPFRSHQNLSHYYGVGAYLRPLSELRNHGVKFTSECLGFSNIPIERNRNTVLGGDQIATHNPQWKRKTPRDIGTGWDFEDVRDHYLETLYGVNAVKLRSFDPEKYLKLSELVTGEIMSQVYSEWRSSHSDCGGGLVWFMKDLWLGAGWGIIDSLGSPKACYYYLKRIWQPVNVMLTDESLNGIDLHICNESENNLEINLEIIMLNHQDVVIAQSTTSIFVAKQSNSTLNVEKTLGGFYDSTYAYRFGPPKHKLVAVRVSIDEKTIAESFLFQDKEIPQTVSDASLDIKAESETDEQIVLRIESDKFLYGVSIEADGYLANNNFFHLLPKRKSLITLTKRSNYTGRFKCFVSAINLAEEVRVKI